MSARQRVIIIGAARSGTKFLRDSLAAAEGVVAVPYDIGFVWRLGNESYPDDAIPPSNCSDKIARYIRDYVDGHGSGDDIVVEKTVGNSLRVDFVRRVFPDAKFVFLIRDGRAVVESSYRQWQMPPNWRYLLRKLRSVPARNVQYGIKYASNMLRGLVSRRSGARIWGPRYPGISEDVAQLDLVRVCARQWVRCVESSLEQCARIDPSNVMQVRYEDLVRDTDALIEICRFAGIVDTDGIVERFGRNVRVGADRWSDGLTVDQQSQVIAEIGDLLDELGY